MSYNTEFKQLQEFKECKDCKNLKDSKDCKECNLLKENKCKFFYLTSTERTKMFPDMCSEEEDEDENEGNEDDENEDDEYGYLYNSVPIDVRDRELAKILSNNLCEFPGIQKGDLISIFGKDTYRNEGIFIYDGEKVIVLDTTFDEYGHLPSYFTVEEFGPKYWHRIFSITLWCGFYHLSTIFLPTPESIKML